jgi:hypothetical protein
MSATFRLAPGKWNKIEHRMFCHITENWRGRPLIDHAVIVQLIGNTTTTTGLAIQAELDQNVYPTGIAISDQQMKEFKFISIYGILTNGVSLLQTNRTRWPYCHGHALPPSW